MSLNEELTINHLLDLVAKRCLENKDFDSDLADLCSQLKFAYRCGGGSSRFNPDYLCNNFFPEIDRLAVESLEFKKVTLAIFIILIEDIRISYKEPKVISISTHTPLGLYCPFCSGLKLRLHSKCAECTVCETYLNFPPSLVFEDSNFTSGSGVRVIKSSRGMS